LGVLETVHAEGAETESSNGSRTSPTTKKYQLKRPRITRK
jgi:hypothetical protein